jgi:hypothetical protein
MTYLDGSLTAVVGAGRGARGGGYLPADLDIFDAIQEALGIDVTTAQIARAGLHTLMESTGGDLMIIKRLIARIPSVNAIAPSERQLASSFTKVTPAERDFVLELQRLITSATDDRPTQRQILMAGVLAYAAKHNIEIPSYITRTGELANNPRL